MATYLISLTANIVSSYSTSNSGEPASVPDIIGSVYNALKSRLAAMNLKRHLRTAEHIMLNFGDCWTTA